MAYVVAGRSGSWEIRESRTTAAGPRSRTLATFRTLTADVLERAAGRSAQGLDAEEVRRAARRAGAPVAGDPSDRAAAELLAGLEVGRRPRAILEHMLRDALAAQPSTARAETPATAPTPSPASPASAALSASARAAVRWLAETPQRRGETLQDLLLLADRLPSGRSPEGPRFPRIASRPA